MRNIADLDSILATIDRKGKAVLDAGERWSQGILVFGTDINLPAEHDKAIDERLREWEHRIVEKNGRKSDEIPATHIQRKIPEREVRSRQNAIVELATP
jgi:hypothetical protein